MNKPSWQSTLVALAFMALVGGIFVIVFEKDGIDEALKAWAALGTLVGVLIGAIPTYFFGQQATAVAKEENKRALDTAGDQATKLHEALERAQEATSQAQLARGENEVQMRKAEAKFDALAPHVPLDTLKEVQEARPELFAKGS
jgi:SpoVK/Ycf46/Vps4 family AAA+-type ATPase